MSELNERIQEGIENIGQSGVRYEAVDLSSVDYTPTAPFRAIYVGGAGHINLTGLDGVTVLFSNLPAGSLLPLGGRGIVRSGTTATLIDVIR
jgi:hypothetical protein